MRRAPASRSIIVPSSPGAMEPSATGPIAADSPYSATMRQASSLARRMSSTAPTDTCRRGAPHAASAGHTAV